MNKNSQRKGVTLIELVIYMGILSIILVVFIDMFALLFDKQLETESNSSVQQDSNYILSRLPYEFGRAQSIEIPATAGATTSSLRLVIDAGIYDYRLFDNNLVMDHDGVTQQVNGYDTTVSNLTFQRLGENNQNDVVQIKFTLSSKAKKQSGSEVNQFSTTLGIREKP